MDQHIKNLLWFYQEATPDELSQADWYHNAHLECLQAASELHIHFKRFVWAVAALSPMCYWERNILGVIQLAKSGKTGHGFGQNRVKALRCLDGDLEALKGPKVTRFANNLLDPDEFSDDVVVDMWALRAYEGRLTGKAQAPTPKQYAKIATAYQIAAETVGLSPSAFQAVVWVVIRRLGKAEVLRQRSIRHAEKQASAS